MQRWWGDWQNANIKGCLKCQVLKGTVSLRCWFRTAWHTNQKKRSWLWAAGRRWHQSFSQSMDREDALGAGRGGLNPVRFVLFPGPTRKYKGHGVPLCAVIWCDHRRAVNPLRVSVYSTEPRLQVRNSTLNVVNTT